MVTKTFNTNLPAIDREGSLSKYLAQIKKFPMLSAEKEYMLAKNWRTTGNLKSAIKCSIWLILFRTTVLGCDMFKALIIEACLALLVSIRTVWEPFTTRAPRLSK